MIPASESMPQTSKNIIGPNLREARDKHKPPLTQLEVSARLAAEGVTIDRAGISKIEIGERSVYDFEVKALAGVLGVSITWLMKE
jgi:transcriptional regulator with XRE-family HTH domain